MGEVEVHKLKPWLMFLEGDDGGSATDTTDDTTDDQQDDQEDEQQPATWESLFDGEDPKEVRKQLEHAREWERRAKANKTAADELAALKAEDATPGDDPADVSPSDSELTAARYKVALENGLTLEDADLFLTATTEEGMTAQAERFAEVATPKKPKRRDLGDSRDRTPPAPTLKSGADLYDRVKANHY